MSITSPVFLSLYLPLVPLGLWLCGRARHGETLQRLWLMLCSLLFLVLSDPGQCWVPLLLIVAACLLPRWGKVGCGLLTALSLGLLLVTRLVSGSMPVGLSFMAVQTIAMAEDIRRGRATRPGFGETVLTLSFYPKYSAGPIVRLDGTFAPRGRLGLDAEALERGLTRVAVGLGKKLLIADALSPLLQSCYGAAHPFAAWSALVLAPIVVYFDFSGHVDMACGIARMLGITLPENFDHPFCAASMRQFWRKWHITLSRFFMDYLYIPLGGSRRGQARTCLHLLLVFLASGLWHGFTGCYLAFGLIHAAAVILEHLGVTRPERWSSVPRRLYVCGVAAVSFVVFMAPSLGDVLTWLRSLTAFGADLTACGTFLTRLTVERQIALAAVLAIALFGERLRGWLEKHPLVRRALVSALLIVAYAHALSAGRSLPLYAQF